MKTDIIKKRQRYESNANTANTSGRKNGKKVKSETTTPAPTTTSPGEEEFQQYLGYPNFTNTGYQQQQQQPMDEIMSSSNFF